jgi:hypothetical protein
MSARSAVIIIGPVSNEALESSYARSFADLRWDVHRWTPAVALAAAGRGSFIGRNFARFVRVEAWERRANLDLLRLVASVRPRLLLVIDTGGVRAGTLGQIRARCPETAIFCVYPDSPHSLDVERIVSLPLFDRVATSSPAWVDQFGRLGAVDTRYLPFAADTTLHAPAAPDPAYRADVSFVGTWRPERETFLEGFADLDLRIWGNEYWRTRTRSGSAVRARWTGRTLRGDELGKVCASSRIMLNVMDAATWPGPNMRNFEQAACAAFSLTTRTSAVLEIFTEGENIECFADIAEARAKVERYLREDGARVRIARAGYDLVAAHHTYADRVATLVDWLGSEHRGREAKSSAVAR